MSELALFDMERTPAPEPAVKLSADRRRTIRQLQALERRRHPLSLLHSVPLALHPDAPDPRDRDAPGPRCGSCLFREPASGWATFPKCVREISGIKPFVTASAASDCRAWWPGCQHWTSRG
jgi:hypothetical protein